LPTGTIFLCRLARRLFVARITSSSLSFSFLGLRVDEFGATCEDDVEGCGPFWFDEEEDSKTFSTVDGSRTIGLVGPGGFGGFGEESLDFLAFPLYGGRSSRCGPLLVVEVDGLFSVFCFFFPSDFVMVKIG
jgi:hypothetical protein